MLEARGLALHFGPVAALDGFDLTVPDGQVVSVLGPSGCGKSTLLRVIAGLQPVEAGDVLWDGISLRDTPPHRRGFGLMFQDYSLFPHKTVAGNVAFGLRMAGMGRAEVSRRVDAALERVGLPGYRDRSIGNLSGGEQQRVALARALAPEPRLLMLDEPLGALDRTLRERLLGELRQLFADLGITAIYVTHDQEEAFALADHVVVMRAGRVEQEGGPEEVWRRPAGEWVARFLGLANIVEAQVEDGWAVTPWGRFPVAPAGAAVDGAFPKGTAAAPGAPAAPVASAEAASTAAATAEVGAAPTASAAVRLVLRPDAITVVPLEAAPEGVAERAAEGAAGAAAQGAAEGAARGTVVSRVFRGGGYLLRVQVDGGPVLEVEVTQSGVPQIGARVGLTIAAEGAFIVE
jgi:thiamine transport system ATP-binding protein